MLSIAVQHLLINQHSEYVIGQKKQLSACCFFLTNHKLQTRMWFMQILDTC